MVAKSFGEMSEIVDQNLSVSGTKSQAMSGKSKLSLVLIIVGLLLFGYGLFSENGGLSYEKIIGFIITATGTGLFFDKKWYYSAGSMLFVLGIAMMYIGYTSKKDIKYLFALYGFATMIVGSFLFTFDNKKKFSLFGNYSKQINWTQRIGLFLAFGGLGIILVAWFGKIHFNPSWLYLILSLGGMAFGILVYTYGSYKGHTAGIKNNYVMFNSLSSRGVLGFAAAIILTLFYIQLYWNSEPLTDLISLFDPWSQLRNGTPASSWFVYGTLYSFVILFLGIKFIIKYRHNRYQIIRTLVVIFSQLILADLLPSIMEALNYNGSAALVDGKQMTLSFSGNPINTWPLNYGAYTSKGIHAYTYEGHQPAGIAYLFWGIAMFLIITPLLTYLVGKRWYCSWVCGCGGLAETAGDSFRHLSNKSVKAWNIERWVLHSIMVFVLLMTIATLYPYLTGHEYELGFMTLNKVSFYFIVSSLLIISAALLNITYSRSGKKHKFLLVGSIIFICIFVFLTIAYFSSGKDIFMISSKSIKKAYGFFIGAAFSGVIGVGFYPILGNRVWCRFGCPMAGYMGLFQRFKSRFRITTNGSQCISCGNCSTYCEQGIDVRAYAQKGENIVRASCVGCGICSAVCPRGVLKLENGPEDGRFKPNPLEITKDGVKLNH